MATWIQRHREERMQFTRSSDSLALTKREMKAFHLDILKRQKELVNELHEMFDITQKDYPHCYIKGVELPNSVFKGFDDEKIATALGLTAHYLTVVADILDVHLRYPLFPRSSRSIVVDIVSINIDGHREFPLFEKGSEKVRFEYGVFLLNKNIEQLMNRLGLLVKNLRNTLPNIMLLQKAVNTHYLQYTSLT